MSAAVLDLINLYDGEGAVIFIEHQNRGKPSFDMKSSAVVKALAGGKMTGHSSVLVAVNNLYHNPLMLASRWPKISVDCVYAESVELANFLVAEARKQEGAVYASAEGLTIKDILRHNSSNNVHDSNVQPHACFFIAEHTGQEQAIWHAAREQCTPKGPE
ncbi:uncharacterized protein EDB93DRAFT_1107302 [Suillus bovinus]|uniref:uncharacterized protein n=1 Tax=Suillus bovinus TaxID=48563 RepID=UPI001B877135|nr:uncharacterized protein EDB93DRAFT_1107302 [Suillus bovinus]KAG2134385.1 hypothetical protein EDB93DRAFT_1107302 [Suillus bovinus]